VEAVKKEASDLINAKYTHVSEEGRAEMVRTLTYMELYRRTPPDFNEESVIGEAIKMLEPMHKYYRQVSSIAAEIDERANRGQQGFASQWRAVKLDSLGEGGKQIEGTITKWLKAVGERVNAGEMLYEYSSDYVDAEVPSDCSGVLVEIVVPEGQPVPGQTVIAYMKPD
jgi:biotin carboxyl carrier protein